MQVIITCMEDYEYRVINSHATLFQNSSRFTSNISKNTSKFTSKTNQIKVRGGGHGGGAYPLYASLSQTVWSPQFHHLKGRGYMRLWRLWRDSEGSKTATPLRLSSFRTFLGELDSRISEFC